MDRKRLLAAVEALAEEIESDHKLRKLESLAFTANECAVLRTVVPEAFSVPVLEDLGVSSVGETASAKNWRGKWNAIPLEHIRMFGEALALAREHRSDGAMAQDCFQTIAGSSSLIDAANRALNNGKSLEGAVVSISFFGVRTHQLDRRPWYFRLFA